MAKNQKIKTLTSLLPILIIILIFFSPFLISPHLLTERDNDLGRTYIPLFNFFHDAFWENKSLPLWRPDQMMGESLIGNPLSSIFYPANLLFLTLETHLAAVLYLLLHFFLAGIFTYYLAQSYKLSKLSSLAASLFYAFSTNMLVHLEAGHITMISAFAYFPLTFLAIRKILSTPTFIWLVIGSASFTFMLFTYPTIFYYSVIFILTYSIARIILRFFNRRFQSSYLTKSLGSIFLTFFLTFALSAIVLLPQLEFAPLSTRASLTIEDVAIPLWNKMRFLQSLFIPYLNFRSTDHESFLYLGIVPLLLAFYGFFQLPNSRKILLTIFGVFILLFILGTSTPFFKLAYDFLPYLKYTRVTTRLWFIIAAIVAILAGIALDKIKNIKVSYLLIGLFLIETFFIGYKRITGIPRLSFADLSIYQYLAQDQNLFRVYCTSYCFNPQLTAKYKIQVLHGETPIQDASFVKFLQEAGNYHFANFAVIFPPYQVWQNSNPPIPNALLLGQANVKYVASTYPLEDQNFSFIGKFGNVLLYRNQKFKPRAYFQNSEKPVEISKLTPNHLVFKFEKESFPQTLIFSEIFYPGWIAFAKNQQFLVEKQLPIFRKVTIPADTDSLEVKYLPESFVIGKVITFSTIIALGLWYFHKRKK